MTPIPIALIFGTRPEAIKLGPVWSGLCQRPEVFLPQVIVTAQHRQMLDQMLAVFNITPTIDLDIMQSVQSLSDITTKALIGVQQALEELQPELVLVQGDTATTFAASLAAFYQKIPIGHVEAGLRTADKFSPFPEEINRRLTSVLADVHFAATPRARDNLQAEGIPLEVIFVTGNPVLDALQTILTQKPTLAGTGLEWVEELPGRLLLVTLHRRENLGEPFARICAALKQIVQVHPDVTIVYPVHPNPAVRKAANDLLGDLERVILCPPPDYLVFVPLMARADLIITDSGGIQEEAPALDVPVLVARETTERPEAIEAGAARLVGTDTDNIIAEADRLLTSPSAYAKMSGAGSPFGDGRAALRICQALEYFFNLRSQRPSEFKPNSGNRSQEETDDGQQ